LTCVFTSADLSRLFHTLCGGSFQRCNGCVLLLSVKTPQLTRKSFQKSLEQADRDKLKGAASKVSRYATVRSLVGLGLGIALALRLRQNRAAYFNAFRAMERPESVVFAGGRTGKY
jgi:hypothetical protein